MKKCPYCAEEIQDEAIVCRFCNRDLVSVTPPPVVSAQLPPLPKAAPTQDYKGNKAWFLALLVGFYMSFFSGGFFGPGSAGFFLMWISIALGANGSGPSRWGGGFIFAVLLMVPGLVVEYNSSAGGGAGIYSDTATPIELLSSRGYASSISHLSVEGQVKNITSEPIDRIRAKVTWSTKAGEFVTADEAMIDYRPLMPGQTSPFKVISDKNPLMDNYNVEFAIGSRPIGFKDSRK